MNELTHTMQQPLRPAPPYKTFLQELLRQKKKRLVQETTYTRATNKKKLVQRANSHSPLFH
jgi:hypothetical protein